MAEILKPWSVLGDALVVVAPMIVVCVIVASAVFAVFVVLLPGVGSFFHSAGNRPPNPARLTGLPPSIDSFSYFLVASLFGIVLGMLVKLIGGFDALGNGGGEGNSIVGAIGSAIAVALGVVGTLFVEKGRISFRAPLGALSLLISFLVAGFYWKYLGADLPQVV